MDHPTELSQGSSAVELPTGAKHPSEQPTTVSTTVKGKIS